MMQHQRHRLAASLALLALVSRAAVGGEPACRKVRFATYNTSLNRDKPGQLLAELTSGASAQASSIAAILQTIRPDVVVLNEFDYEPGNVAVAAFQEKFLATPQAPGLEPLSYPHVFTAPVNTGVPSGRDFDHDGRTDGPADAFGYGYHPGQYGMVLLSRFPIDAAAARTFQFFLMRDLPGVLLPTDPATGTPWYSEQDLEVARLSSKSHWDVPVDVPLGAGGPEGASKRVHMLLHHPTPPAFDGPEGRNLLRNHEEIRLFVAYVGCPGAPPSSTSSGSGSRAGLVSRLARLLGLAAGSEATKQQQLDTTAWLYDDAGKRGGLEAGASFVIAGDHNADPEDGRSYERAITQLLDCPAITAAFTPTSEGGREAGNRRPSDKTPPETKTSEFDLRVDYIFPSRGFVSRGRRGVLARQGARAGGDVGARERPPAGVPGRAGVWRWRWASNGLRGIAATNEAAGAGDSWFGRSVMSQ